MIRVDVALAGGRLAPVTCEEVSRYLGVVPEVRYSYSQDAVIYTGWWRVLHIQTGLPLQYSACHTCALAAASLAAEADINWPKVKRGDWWTPKRVKRLAEPLRILRVCRHITSGAR